MTSSHFRFEQADALSELFGGKKWEIENRDKFFFFYVSFFLYLRKCLSFASDYSSMFCQIKTFVKACLLKRAYIFIWFFVVGSCTFHFFLYFFGSHQSHVQAEGEVHVRTGDLQ